MKIKRVYIAAFGGLKNKTVDFKDGFNVIYGENENGKTTVMTFIKMMFYGSERGSSALAKNPRKKYAPRINARLPSMKINLKPLRQRLKGLIRIRRMFYSKFLFYRRGLRL